MEIIEIENLKYVYAQNIYGKYYIPYNSIHRPCPQIILKGGVWEYETLKFIESEYRGETLFTPVLTLEISFHFCRRLVKILKC